MKKMINRRVILGFLALFFITSAVAETWDQAKPGVMASVRKANRRILSLEKTRTALIAKNDDHQNEIQDLKSKLGEKEEEIEEMKSEDLRKTNNLRLLTIQGMDF